ncbi:hypothetical protein ISF_05379 [Cordyceps fumosorosea ARSEF 2679]|uniref:Uncharacterized protein n=1 Tax=Cordyceps fumosorosea (strain ARSEF 2679) TaxID=1081104 RepID=A0A167V9C6_CORFA|nr:hypothetical protein ISF_05379 [Cordyceps fumosorosea ARSEF 2679]OAA62370.1 hypothetical protein ISF_05379 [Cordyceps fumosorosea ARSEF 2679]
MKQMSAVDKEWGANPSSAEDNHDNQEEQSAEEEKSDEGQEEQSTEEERDPNDQEEHAAQVRG